MAAEATALAVGAGAGARPGGSLPRLLLEIKSAAADGAKLPILLRRL